MFCPSVLGTERSKNYRDYKCRMLPHGTQGYPGRGRKGPHCHQGSIWCWWWHSNVKCGKIGGFFGRVRPFIFFAIKVIKVARKPPWRCTATDFKVGLTYSTRPGRQIQDSLGGDVIGTTAKLVLHFSGLHTHLLFFKVILQLATKLKVFFQNMRRIQSRLTYCSDGWERVNGHLATQTGISRPPPKMIRKLCHP